MDAAKNVQQKQRSNEMKFSHKIRIAICLLICVFFVMSGCTSHKSDVEDGRLKVVSTIFASYDFARQIAGDCAQVSMLLKPGMESHSYEPTPRDIISIQECDVFIYVGGENDAWVDNILESMDTSEMTIIKMIDLVEKYEEEHVEGMEGHVHSEECEHENEHGHEHHEEWDEHVWTSPLNAVEICNKITEVFCEKDSVNSKVYTDNSNRYIEELNILHGRFTDIVQNADRNVIVFGDRFPLRYFVEEYDLEYYAAFPGCSSDTEASAATVVFLIDKIREEEIPVVFKIELSSDSMARTIAEDTNTKVMVFNTCHNITRDEFNAGETYVSLMYRNAEALKEALE